LLNHRTIAVYRIIFSDTKFRTIDCVFAERRSIVCEAFAAAMFDRLMRDRAE
jgi:hypothetical protein